MGFWFSFLKENHLKLKFRFFSVSNALFMFKPATLFSNFIRLESNGKAVFPRFPVESIAPINLSPCGDTKLSDISTKKCACVNKSNAFSISNHNYSPGSSSLNILPEALSLNHRNFRNSGVIGSLLLYLPSKSLY